MNLFARNLRVPLDFHAHAYHNIKHRDRIESRRANSYGNIEKGSKTSSYGPVSNGRPFLEHRDGPPKGEGNEYHRGQEKDNRKIGPHGMEDLEKLLRIEWE